MDPSYGHSRTRTTSSSVFPSQHPQHQQYHHQQYQHHQHSPPPPPQPQQQQQYSPHHHQEQHPHQHQQQLHQNHGHQHQNHPMHPAQQHHHQQPSPQSASNPQLWRRSPSIGAFSNASSFQQQPPAAYRTSTSDLRRSTSSRSVTTQGGGSSYVALLRKQKATVWCERAQYEDPRLVAQQRAAKVRANLEVVSGNTAGRTQTGLASAKVAGKIRHGSKAQVVGYAPGETHVGVGGVPLRLSAREIDGDGSDDDDNAGPMMATRKDQQHQHHRRAGSSGRSSTGSGRQAHHRTSGSGTPARNPSLVAGTPERTESLASRPQQHKQSVDESAGPTDDAASGRAQSSRSGNSERRDDVLELGQGPKLAHNSKLNSALTREKSVKSPEELKRRGSVDERTSTLTSGRLFIANPD
ncbi:hypothetical protein CCM_03066 [Cordyceps militaris CM01]|uniref:Uncharacterized protein n=1 Tax=Cordyceps militaris (strain CM01) TaxID=983644 RepID=G3J8K8_CORMM|nr:uncharacterized protein CCM_03066 [Cordyceps militaris CM01]EGX94795.1 hypothetical protein CCM_03066 [Cordyceps militaris CM01]